MSLSADTGPDNATRGGGRNEAAANASRPLAWLPANLRGVVGAVALFVAVLIAASLASPNFLQINNLSNVSREAAIVGVVAVGMTFVILTGGIDLSVGSVLAVTGVVSATFAQSGHSPVVAIVAGMAAAVVFGVVNGVGITALGIPPFIMTLATLVIARGVALRISDGSPKAFMSDSAVWSAFGNGKIGPVPGPLVIFLIVAFLGWFVLRYTRFGRQVYAVGGSPEVARFAGVIVWKVKLGVYCISGFTAGLAGVMTTAQLSVGAPTAGNLMELEAIAAVVIGGTRLLGGVGGMLGTIFGAFLLAILANFLNLLGVGPFDQQIVRGLIIIIAVVLTAGVLKKRLTLKR